jgi:hypothetical protein
MSGADLELIALLRKAAKLVRSGSDVHSDYFKTAADFAKAIDRLADLIQGQDANLFAKLKALCARKLAKYTWSASTFDLDDYLGKQAGPEFANSIYEML